MSLYDMVSRIYQWVQSILSDVLGVSAAVKALQADADAKFQALQSDLDGKFLSQGAAAATLFSTISQNQAAVLVAIAAQSVKLDAIAGLMNVLAQNEAQVVTAIEAEQAVLQKILAAVTTPPAVSGRFVIGAEVPK